MIDTRDISTNLRALPVKWVVDEGMRPGPITASQHHTIEDVRRDCSMQVIVAGLYGNGDVAIEVDHDHLYDVLEINRYGNIREEGAGMYSDSLEDLIAEKADAQAEAQAYHHSGHYS